MAETRFVSLQDQDGDFGLILRDRTKTEQNQTVSDCLSVGRRQRTVAFETVFGVVPTPRSGRLSRCPQRSHRGARPLCPHSTSIWLSARITPRKVIEPYPFQKQAPLDLLNGSPDGFSSCFSSFTILFKGRLRPFSVEDDSGC